MATAPSAMVVGFRATVIVLRFWRREERDICLG